MSTSHPQSLPVRAKEFQCLYDVSWTLHRLQWPNLSNRPQSLLSNSRNRINRARQLQDFLHVDVTGPEAEITFDEKAGAIRKCDWDLLEAADREQGAVLLDARGRPVAEEEVGSGIMVTLTYDAATYSVILCGPAASSQASSSALSDELHQSPSNLLPLLLTKTPMPLTKRIFTFLLDTFDILISPLKLPASLLDRTLESYIDTLCKHASHLSTARRDGFLNIVLRDIKITFSFGAPVAPSLRTLDADIPANTVCNLIQESLSTKTSFMRVLAIHLLQHTGLRLPMLANSGGVGDGGDGGDDGDDGEAVRVDQIIRISKIVTQAFAMSGDGRFKLVEKARIAAESENMGGIVREANVEVLSALLEEAIKG